MRKYNSISDKLIIFDLDGTLLNTSNLISESLYETIIQYVEIKRDDITSKLKNSPYAVLKEYTGYSNLREKMRKYWSSYNQYLDSHVEAYPQVDKTLLALKKENYGIALVTSLISRNALKLIDLYIDIDFDITVTYNDTTQHKPDPEPINLAIDKYSSHLDKLDLTSIYIGDTLNDMKAGKQAGILTGLAGWGLNQKDIQEISRFNPDYIFNKPIEILNINI